MSRRYDSKTTTFSPDGRLQQVEYALENINKYASAIGVLTPEGMILATEKQEVSHLLEQSKDSEKIYCIDKHIYCVVSGLAADANQLIDYARVAAQQYRYHFQFQFLDNIPMEQLIVRICDLKQSYTQYGGMRPFGTAFLFAGYDKTSGFQLFSTDPSGNYGGWKATAIGQNNLAANSFLKQEYKDDLTLEQVLQMNNYNNLKGINISIKALVKTMDTSSPSPQKIEIVIISRDSKNDIHGKSLTEKDVLDLLKRNGFNQDSAQE